MVDLPDVLDLTEPQTRVLGCLIEKQAATPDAYPLTLKALTAACNQTSNRDPVVDYSPQLVETTVQALKGKGLARIVHPGSGERASKKATAAATIVGPMSRYPWGAHRVASMLQGSVNAAITNRKNRRVSPLRFMRVGRCTAIAISTSPLTDRYPTRG